MRVCVRVVGLQALKATRLTKEQQNALQTLGRRAAMIAEFPHSHVQQLRSNCVWALVRVGNVSQSSSMETVPVENTLNVLMDHFKDHFFDRQTRR